MSETCLAFPCEKGHTAPSGAHREQRGDFLVLVHVDYQLTPMRINVTLKASSVLTRSSTLIGSSGI